MSFQEKSAWVLMVVSTAVAAWFGHGLWEAGSLTVEGNILKAVIVFVVLAVVAHIAVAAIFNKSSDVTDERDRRIGRRGEVAGGFVLGGMTLLVIALALKDENWLIANIAFLGLLGSEIVKSLWQVILYRVEG